MSTAAAPSQEVVHLMQNLRLRGRPTTKHFCTVRQEMNVFQCLWYFWKFYGTSTKGALWLMKRKSIFRIVS